MKFSKKALIFSLIFLFLLSQNALSGTWVDSWFSNAVITYGTPTMIKGSSRNYYSAGYGSIRWQTGMDYPITIGLPQIRFGCGGVDIFLGSMDLMSFDYLVSRLKNIMYTAAAFAFQYALARLNPKANQILQALDATANFLNSLQLDECRAGKAIATVLMRPFSQEAAEAFGVKKAELSQILGDVGSWREVRDKWEKALGLKKTASSATAADIARAKSGCPATLNTILQKRYFLDYLASKGLILPQFVPLIRGIVGDIEVDPDVDAVFRIEPCGRKSSDLIASVLNGTAQKCVAISGTACVCRDFTEGKDLKKQVKNYLSRYMNLLYGKEKAQKNSNSINVRAFMMALTYYPVYDMIKMAYQVGLNASDIAGNSRLVECATEFYAAGLLSNALSQAERMRKMITDWKAACSRAADVGRCFHCTSGMLDDLERAVNQFILDVSDKLSEELAVDKVAKRSEQCMSLEREMLVLNRLSQMEQLYTLHVRVR